MPKILFVAHSSGLTGGGEDDYERLLNFFSHKNHYEIYGFFPFGQRASRYAEYCIGFECYRYGWVPYNYEGILPYAKYVLKFFWQYIAFKKILKFANFDLVVFNVGALPFLNLLFYLYKKKQIVFIRETIKPDLVRKTVFKIINLVSDCVITVSDKNSEDYKRITNTAKPVYTIFSAVEKIQKNLLPGDEKIAELFGKGIYDNLGIKTNLRLLNIGNISPIKNQLLIINALSIIQKKNQLNTPFVFFIGDNTEKKQYVREVCEAINNNNLQDKVFFLGRQLSPIIYKIITMVDAVIISSKNEGMPLVISEAMQLGAPIISTKAGGVEDIIKDGVNGLLCDNNPESVSSAIEKISNPDLRESLIHNSEDTVRENFDLDKNMIKIEQIFDSVI